MISTGIHPIHVRFGAFDTSSNPMDPSTIFTQPQCLLPSSRAPSQQQHETKWVTVSRTPSIDIPKTGPEGISFYPLKHLGLFPTPQTSQTPRQVFEYSQQSKIPHQTHGHSAPGHETDPTHHDTDQNPHQSFNITAEVEFQLEPSIGKYKVMNITFQNNFELEKEDLEGLKRHFSDTCQQEAKKAHNAVPLQSFIIVVGLVYMLVGTHCYLACELFFRPST